MRTVLKFFWSDWRIGLGVVLGIAAGAGLISAWLIPRGPVTTPQAQTSMAAAFLLAWGRSGLRQALEHACHTGSVCHCVRTRQARG